MSRVGLGRGDDEPGRKGSGRSAGARFDVRSARPAEARVLPWYLQSVWWIGIGAGTLFCSVGWRISEIELGELVNGLPSVGPLASALVRPDFSILRSCWWAMVETVCLAFMATVFAVPLAVVLSFFGARNIMPTSLVGNVVYGITRLAFTVVRSVEPIVWAIVFVVWVGLSPFAGILALMVHSVAAMGKLYSEDVEHIEVDPLKAIRATGASELFVLVHAVWPQVEADFVGTTFYRWDCNVRMATIVGMVGGGGIGALLIQYQGMGRWSEVALIALMITLVVWGMDALSARVRREQRR